MPLDLQHLAKKFISSPKTKDILTYESHVWRSADTLRSSVGLKDSDFPRFMMCFLALALVESRIVRAAQRAIAEYPDDAEYYVDEVKDQVGLFYNPVIVEQGITMRDLVKTSTGFDSAFSAYLEGFSEEFKRLVGISEGNDDENLNLAGRVRTLKSKDALISYLSSWAEVDLTPYDNYEVTTLEEHIKRKWADMSAETAGEQYTPSDIGYLITLLVASKKGHATKSGNKIKIYDMTCGGGNLLYGVEDKLIGLGFEGLTETYGQELNGPLYSLAKIESSFRPRSFIEQGNTLINDRFSGITFDVGVANPPYGVAWGDVKKEIENDETGRYTAGKPSTSDGQLLFVQHMISKLNADGVAFIVLNGSPLFSGDAGGGESNIRKWILDNDYLEALIQLPTNEFFNTGITTYIWCVNKNKPDSLKDKIICINAENLFTKLKKNKGSKSKEISVEQAAQIVEWFENPENAGSAVVKLKSKFDFYYNKQAVLVAELDENGNRVKEPFELKISEFMPVTLGSEVYYDTIWGSKEPTALVPAIYLYDTPEDKIPEVLNGLNDYLKNVDNMVLVGGFINEKEVGIFRKNRIIQLETDTESLNPETRISLGAGKLSAVYKKSKATKQKEASGVWLLKIEPLWIKDYEKINYYFDSKENAAAIENFMKTWVNEDSKQWQLLDNVVGVEINFNQVFPKKIEIRSVADILKDLEAL